MEPGLVGDLKWSGINMGALKGDQDFCRFFWVMEFEKGGAKHGNIIG